MIVSATFVRDFISLARKTKESDEFPFAFLRSPCQVTALFIKSQNLLFLIAKHEPELKDLEVTNYVVDSIFDARAMLDKKVLADPYWRNQSTLVEVAGQFGLFLSGESIRMVSDIPARFSARLIGFKAERKVYDGCMLFSIDKKKETPKDLVFRVIGQIKRRLQEIRKSEEREETTSYLLSAFWYPPFVFEAEPVTLTSRFVIDTPYKNHRVMFDNKSFISVISPMKPPLKDFLPKALEIFNEIIGVANLYNIDGTAISPDEVVIFEFSKDLKQQYGVSFRHTPTIRSVVFEEYYKDPPSVYRFDQFCPFKYLKKSTVVEVIKKAEVITQNTEIKNYVPLFLDAKTHFLIHQHKTAFLLGWLVVEKYVDSLWAETLSNRGISGKRYNKLAKSIFWTIDDELEALNLIGQISNQRYSQISRLKGIRNAVIHRERKVQPKEAEECIKLTTDVVRELIRSRCFVE